ncbi:cobalamin B12-binding domain-containing protein [Egicoccus halophilus]|uniref:Cobalamin-binding protein n=1 Tax=Egicoccus halophilus TaxID=1670830 RepID=A0A8J3A742_9ACTN|nr:B12-binding domain-containing protein [Egicoccus halophilus]GGI05064.1 cobalamin-binding protein [Egicoccus halophilus]
MVNEVTTAAHERLLAVAETGDVDGAFALLHGWLDAGWTPSRILSEAVVPAQQEVGARWQRNEWTIAKEHTATAVVDALVGVLGLRAAEQPWTRPNRDPVLVVCAEGEWHTLSARLVTEGLRAEGWPVRLLGGSVPASHLAHSAAEGTWTAAVVCCAVPMFLPGARRTTAVLRAAGIPVLVTGRGFGGDDRRAEAVGADGWAPDLATGLEVLGDWERVPPPLAGAPVPPDEVEELASVAGSVAEAAYAELAVAWPALGRLPSAARQRTREDFGYLLQFLEATVLTGDERILRDYVDWLATVLGSRGVPDDVVSITLASVQRALPTGLRHAHDALLSVRDR